MAHWRRRDFLGLLGVAAAWPLSARAQQGRRIGYLSSRTEIAEATLVDAFGRGLHEAGHSAGRDVGIEFRWADGEYDRLPALAADLLRRDVAIIVATDTNAALAARREIGGAIPLVFLTGRDPIADGLVTSLHRPGGATTGIAVFTSELGPKRLEILRELAPRVTTIAFLVPRESATAELQIRGVIEAGRTMNLQVDLHYAARESDLDSVFEAMARNNIGAVLHGASAVYQNLRDRLVALALRHRLPGMYEWPEFVTAGGIASYSPHRGEVFRQAGLYTGKILSGTNPSDLPVLQPTRFELLINLKTARAIGLDIPLTLLARADEVIE
jgi:putative ABC transport system substrate-binding protein